MVVDVNAFCGSDDPRRRMLDTGLRCLRFVLCDERRYASIFVARHSHGRPTNCESALGLVVRYLAHRLPVKVDAGIAILNPAKDVLRHVHPAVFPSLPRLGVFPRRLLGVVFLHPRVFQRCLAVARRLHPLVVVRPVLRQHLHELVRRRLAQRIVVQHACQFLADAVVLPCFWISPEDLRKLAVESVAALDVDLALLRHPKLDAVQPVLDPVRDVRVVRRQHDPSAWLRPLHVHRNVEEPSPVVLPPENAVRSAPVRLVVALDALFLERHLLPGAELLAAQQLRVHGVHELAERHLLDLRVGHIRESECALERLPEVLEPRLQLRADSLRLDQFLAVVAYQVCKCFIADSRLVALQVAVFVTFRLGLLLYAAVVVAALDELHAALPEPTVYALHRLQRQVSVLVDRDVVVELQRIEVQRPVCALDSVDVAVVVDVLAPVRRFLKRLPKARLVERHARVQRRSRENVHELRPGLELRLRLFDAALSRDLVQQPRRLGIGLDAAEVQHGTVLLGDALEFRDQHRAVRPVARLRELSLAQPLDGQFL